VGRFDLILLRGSVSALRNIRNTALVLLRHEREWCRGLRK
jgi:hypothetical protein